LITGRPFVYLWQIKDAFVSAMQEPASTTVELFPSISVTNGSHGLATTTYTLPSLSETDMSTAFPSDKAKPFRDASTVVMVMGFVFEIWALRHKFL